MKLKSFFQMMLVIVFFSTAALTPTWSVGIFLTCADHIAKQETEKGIPQGLLKAIAMVESRISPWAVNALGRAHFFKSKEAAAKFIRGLVARGVGNIGIGCMQLHYASHHRHFKSVEDMLEPKNNIAHAAKLLRHLKSRYGSIERAVKLYHSASPYYHNIYKTKVYGAWTKIQSQNKSQNASLKSVAFKAPYKTPHAQAIPNIKFGVGAMTKKKG
jgi:hypothetical protein